MSDSPADKEIDYQLLRQIAEHENSNQRDLARRMGVSVGKINYCLRAVIDRGWVKVNNFRRADNKWAYAYLLTPSGARAKIRLTRAFLASKELEFEQLEREIEMLRSEVHPSGSGNE